MATMPNTNINIPYSAFLDPTTGRPTQAWLLWLMSPSFINVNIGTALPVTSGGTGLTTIPTNGQLLIGNGTGYTLNTLGYGAGISVTNAAGTITVANTGVLSNIAGTGISVSSATGNVTIANTGVLSWAGGTTGLTPAAATTGAVTLAGTLIAVNGGTGQASYAIGDLLYADTTTTLAKLPDVATGNALISGGISTAPAWGKIGLTTHVSGVLPIANGGTNGTSVPTAGAVPYGTGTAYGFTSAGTSGQVLTSAGAGTPTWTTPTTGTVTSVSGTGTVNGITLTGTVTSSGSLTLGGTLGGIGNSQLTNSTISGVSLGGSLFNLTAGTGVSFSSGTTYNGSAAITITATGSGGTVTSVTGTSPVVSSGGTTPAISIPAATTSVSGYLTSTDWNTFNNKGSGTVTSVSGTTGRITSTGGTTPVIDLASGVASAGTTGSSTLIPVVTIDTYGRVTSITTAANPQGTVTSVTGTSPVLSSGGATPAISLAAAYGDTLNPYASKTANYVLAAPNGSAGVPTFRALVAADVPGSALTKTDDTNVTLTLGGSPTTALLNAASLTLGWTGQLGISRGGTNTSTAPSAYGVVYGNSSGTAYTSLANGTTGQVLTATTSGAPSWAAPAYTGTVTSVSFTGGIITVATATTTPALTVAGTSGGIPYFSSGTTWASSAALTQYGVVYGGGAAGTSILLASVGDATTLVSDGTNWIAMSYTPNNILLL